jgi:hypothetical protein
MQQASPLSRAKSAAAGVTPGFVINRLLDKEACEEDWMGLLQQDREQKHPGSAIDRTTLMADLIEQNIIRPEILVCKVNLSDEYLPWVKVSRELGLPDGITIVSGFRAAKALRKLGRPITAIGVDDRAIYSFK